MTPSLYLLEEQARALVRHHQNAAPCRANAQPAAVRATSLHSFIAGLVGLLSRHTAIAESTMLVRADHGRVRRHRPLPSPRPSSVGRRCEQRLPALHGPGARW